MICVMKSYVALFLFFAVLQFEYSQIAFAQSEAVNVNPLVTQLQETLSTLISTQEEFNKNAAGLRNTSRRIIFLTKKINLFLVFGTQNKCREGIRSTMARLKIIILKLEKNRCKSSSTTIRCIDAQVFDNFFQKVNDSLESAKQIFEIDKDGDKIQDVCEK